MTDGQLDDKCQAVYDLLAKRAAQRRESQGMYTLIRIIDLLYQSPIEEPSPIADAYKLTRSQPEGQE